MTLIDQLQSAGILQPVDAALGRLLVEHSPPGQTLVGYAAALASAALAAGHSCVPLQQMPTLVTALASNDVALPALPDADAVRSALLQSPLVARNEIAPAALVFDTFERIYLRRYFRFEVCVVDALRSRLANAVALDADNARVLLDQTVGATIDDDGDQQTAVALALRSRFLIISGGPGTGKTTTVLRVLAALERQHATLQRGAPRIALAAPTGKAAARLSHVLRNEIPRRPLLADSALPATTLHRLLGVRPGRARSLHDRMHPLPFDLVVVDEASMLDLALAARLCDALAPETRLILLGDRDQLASVEAGSVFGALCSAVPTPGEYSHAQADWLQRALARQSAASPLMQRVSVANPLADALIELRHSHRFGAASAIGPLAAAIRRGDASAASALLSVEGSEVGAREIGIAALAASVAQSIVPRYLACAQAQDAEQALRAAEDFRVLCALRDGPFGARSLNAMIEDNLRGHAQRVDANGWFSGRLIIVSANNYAQGLFNGDLGVALASGVDGSLEVWFRTAAGELRSVAPELLSAHEGAYALTVHKAQGSEFGDVLVVLPQRDARVLTRELVYTAVTRARRNVQMWTSPAILDAAIGRCTQRWSGLVDRLRERMPAQ